MHAFISYRSKDKYQLQALISELKAAEIPFWADMSIEAGESWRDEIDLALEQASILVVIITEKSVESLYVTYEWAWALGHGIPVIPLIFDEIETSKIHARLNAIEWVNCYPAIPNHLVSTLQNKMTKNRLHRYVDDLVLRKCIDARISTLLALWTANYGLKHDLSKTKIRMFIDAALKSLRQLGYETLPSFWVQSSHSFTTRQKQNLAVLGSSVDKLATEFVHFSNACLSYGDGRDRFVPKLREVEIEWNNVTEPMLESFGERKYYQFLKQDLNSAESHHYTSDEFWREISNLGNYCYFLGSSNVDDILNMIEDVLGRGIPMG